MDVGAGTAELSIIEGTAPACVSGACCVFGISFEGSAGVVDGGGDPVEGGGSAGAAEGSVACADTADLIFDCEIALETSSPGIPRTCIALRISVSDLPSFCICCTSSSVPIFFMFLNR